MKLVLFMSLVAVLSLIFTGCMPSSYETTSNTTFSNVMPNQVPELRISKASNMIQFEVYYENQLIEVDECALRDNNTAKLLTNYGDNKSMVFVDMVDSNYTFGVNKNGRCFTYDFNLSELAPNITIEME